MTDSSLTDAAYDTALVSLDLASLYAEQGRMAELKRIAEEMVPFFSSRQIHREALAALDYWRQAVEAERGLCQPGRRGRLLPEASAAQSGAALPDAGARQRQALNLHPPNPAAAGTSS